MARGKQPVIVLIALAVAALALLITFMSDSPLSTRHIVDSLASSGQGDSALQANITAGHARGGLGAANTEVQIVGRWRGAKVDEVVMRSEYAKPDMLRVGWSGPNSLVISVPQSLEDAGKPLGTDDVGFVCGNSEGPVRVTCQPYTIGPASERHYAPPAPTPQRH